MTDWQDDDVEAYLSRGFRVSRPVWDAAVAKATSQDRSIASVLRLLLEGYVRGTYELLV